MQSLLSSLIWWCKWCLGWRKQVQSAVTPEGNPLPAVIHKVLQPRDLGPGRLIAVGDIHGCYDELLELLRKVEYKPRHDNLVLVGDLVNKGPKSQQVLASARAWCEGSFCWVVRGNHDDAALAKGMYVFRGGQLNALQPKYHWVNELLPEDVDFLTELPFSLEIKGYNVLIVHAGLIPGQPLHAQDLAVLIKMRELVQTPDGSWIGLEKPQENSQPWAGFWRGPGHVIFGHDAKRRLQTAPHATGLDTGCVYGGQLTACVLPPLSTLTESDIFSFSTSNQHAGGTAAEGPTPTLKDLRATLCSVPSGFVFDKAADKKAEKEQKKAVKKAAKHGRK